MTLPVRRSGGAPARRTHPWGIRDSFSEFETLWDEMGRLVERAAAPVGEHPWMPLAEEMETEDAYVVRAELPGVPSENVAVELEGNELCITGEITEEQQGKVLARRTGQFSYRSTLPGGIDSDNIEAELADGVLTVRVPKAEQARRRKIEIGRGRE
ncbi:Hsp20/alpha crystallin family protein [Streptomyces gobiensis]|uniref:Hsp20/alpha crystallin family protein n=1 Tax=Streptomyces gobiensis TaxID=2875706 RepID=UPI001E488AAE|nr:Hsp20/alpha crystallin family protein [Streptomyces gobiensis]UGY92290.1 Hsp20/alpha crystallin family protein [Streptomyces gobiensis]